MAAYNINFLIYDHIKKTSLNLQNFDLYTFRKAFVASIYNSSLDTVFTIPEIQSHFSESVLGEMKCLDWQIPIS